MKAETSPPKKMQSRQKYPHIAFRPSRSMMTRIEAVRQSTGWGVSRIMHNCLAAGMPELERMQER